MRTEGIYDIKAQMDERLAQKEKEAEKLQYEETIYQLRKDAERKERAHEQAIERLQKQKDRQSDRWFQAILVIFGAVLGVGFTLLAERIFK